MAIRPRSVRPTGKPCRLLPRRAQRLHPRHHRGGSGARPARRRVVTRFPPEPNGYLHIGHAKSICLNFGLAREYGGRCHLRFDDTNPTTEDMEYVEAIQRDIRWLGFDWGEHLYFASDYFERLYDYAVELIEKGLAYVDSLERGGDPRVPRHRHRGRGARARTASAPSRRTSTCSRACAPASSRTARTCCARKIDMASPNMKMRDPLLYRIRHAHHYRTGDDVVHLPALRLHPLPRGLHRGHHPLDLHAGVREQPRAVRLDPRQRRRAPAAAAPVRVRPPEPQLHRDEQAQASSSW